MNPNKHRISVMVGPMAGYDMDPVVNVMVGPSERCSIPGQERVLVARPSLGLWGNPMWFLRSRSRKVVRRPFAGTSARCQTFFTGFPHLQLEVSVHLSIFKSNHILLVTYSFQQQQNMQ